MRNGVQESPPAAEEPYRPLPSGVPASPWWPGAVFFTMALCLAVRVIDLGSKSVFADELASIRFAQLNWPAFWHVITSGEANMALYYVLLRFWIRISDSVPFVRFLSVIPAVATVPVIYSIGKKLFSKPAAILAALLFSLNPFHISYSQAARGYSLTVLLVALSCLYFIRSVHDGDETSAIGYVLASTAGLYAHFFAGFVLLSQFVALFFLRSPRATMARQVRQMSIVAVLGMPLFVFAAIHKAGPLAWVQPPTAKDVYHFFTYLTGSGLKLGLSLLALGVAGREWWLRTCSPDEKNLAWPFEFLTIWSLLPLVIALLLSHWKPVFSPRFLMICLPAFLLLLAEGLVGIRPRWALYSVVGALLLSLLTALPSYYRRPGFEDWSAVNKFLSENVRSSDTILVDAAYLDVFEFTFRYSGQALPTRSIVPNPGEKADWWQSSDRIWIISCHPTAQNELPPLPQNYLSGPTTQFTGIKVLQYVKTASR
jgi:mannosyltransferase